MSKETTVALLDLAGSLIEMGRVLEMETARAAMAGMEVGIGPVTNTHGARDFRALSHQKDLTTLPTNVQ